MQDSIIWNEWELTLKSFTDKQFNYRVTWVFYEKNFKQW